MLCPEMRHFTLNRRLLLAIGVWPYERSKLARFRLILFLGILTSYVVFQFTTIFTVKYSINHIIEVVSSSFFFICLLIKYNSFWINANNVRLSLERLQLLCDKLKSDQEIAILDKYGSNANWCATVLTLITMVVTPIIYLLPPIWPYILDVIFPMNKSRPHPPLYIVTEYFVDQEKYFYLIMLHRNAALFIGTAAIVSTGSFFLLYFQHICGIFSIVSFRIENAMKIDIRQGVSREKQIYKDIYKEITYAIDIHCIATECSIFLLSTFNGSFFFLVILGIICASCSLVRIASVNNFEEIITPLIVVTFFYIYLFVSGYNTQSITDHNELIFTTIYSVKWYNAPLHVQKMILFLLQKGTKPFILSIGKIIIGSLETTATILSASISYFTVLYSTR